MKIGTSKKNDKGFSLLELMVTLAVVAVAGGVLYAYMGTKPPSFFTKNAGSEFFSMLQLARTEALQSGRNVVVQPLSDRQLCIARDDDGDNQPNECDSGGYCHKYDLPREVALAAAFNPVTYNTRGRLVVISDPNNPLAQSPATLSVTFCSQNPESMSGCESGKSKSTVSAQYVGMPKIEFGKY